MVMKVSVFGAAGFVGQSLSRRLARDTRVEKLTLVDRVAPSISSQLPMQIVSLTGDLADREVCAQAIKDADAAIVLAAVLGGAAEQNYALSRRINVDATLALFETLRNAERPPRVLFTSSIAVYGTALPKLVDDQTPARPEMVYAAQKLMMEIALSHFTARGWLDGFALRIPGIVARPQGDLRLKSAFLSNLFYAVREGRALILPVDPGGSTWLMSVEKLTDNLIHALFLPGGIKKRHCAVLLPCQCVTFAELVKALQGRFPQSGSTLTFSPDPLIEAQFGQFPQLNAALGRELGFEADACLESLLVNAMPNE
jgi:nucleoside-diphosphate-sugar epimerase